MDKKQKILKFIETIRDSFNDSVKVYTQGSCYKFHLILKEVFPEAECYNDFSHVITKIGDFYYDITGEVEKKGHLLMLEEYTDEMKSLRELKYKGSV